MDKTCGTCHGTGVLYRQDCGAHGVTVGCGDCGGTGGRGKCERCDNAIQHKHGGLCTACMADDLDYDEDANDCANCGGEGFTYGCGWDWQCDTWDGDSCLCTRRCEWCQPLTAAESAERKKLRDIMATALTEHTPKEPPHGH